MDKRRQKSIRRKTLSGFELWVGHKSRNVNNNYGIGSDERHAKWIQK